ncbi:hypothetical protein BGX23_000926 [Mortierella sp. AD031]|nr:hypothetical protein BGX23_000926 [Mortierella sp. AD031]KAG0198220.1 hypothetical protein BGX33_012496 [Mortierella sp. NVP41]
MAKIAIIALLLAQLCILQAQASHYVQFKLVRMKGVMFLHTAGICIHDGERVLMSDYDYFGSGVNDYGFHKDGYSAMVRWNKKNVGITNWGDYSFEHVGDDGTTAFWDGCWTTVGYDCRYFRSKARADCNARLNY